MTLLVARFTLNGTLQANTLTLELAGGYILDGIWIHPQLVDFGLRDRILAVFSGQKPDLDLAPQEFEELRRRYADQEQRSKYEAF